MWLRFVVLFSVLCAVGCTAHRQYHITGRVVGVQSGRPIEGATIAVVTGRPAQDPASVETDPDGKFSISFASSGVPSLDLAVRRRQKDFVSRRFFNISTNEFHTYSVSEYRGHGFYFAGIYRDGEFTCEESHSHRVAGKVLEAESAKPVAGAEVSVFQRAAGPAGPFAGLLTGPLIGRIVAGGFTDEKGNFCLGFDLALRKEESRRFHFVRWSDPELCVRIEGSSECFGVSKDDWGLYYLDRSGGETRIRRESTPTE